MLKSIPKTSMFIAGLVWAGIVSAAGLGGINVTSSLGQPLRAEIEVVALEKGDKSSLRAKLASPEAYKNAGIDYPYTVPKLKFEIEERASGEPYIKVSSAQPVNDPFVTLMVELAWSSGKLMREYTFLLDPADYKPEQPKPEEVKPIEPVVAVPAVVPAPMPLEASAPVAAEPQPEAPLATEAASAVAPAAAESAVATAPVAEAVPGAEAAPAAAPAAEAAAAAAPTEAAPGAEAAPAEKPLTEQALTQEQAPAATAPEKGLAREEAMPEAAPQEHIVVARGDTLTKIAAQIKPADVSLERMLVALYRENAGVFDGHNMNRIRAGKILTVPKSEATQMLPQADAEEEIRAQAADWNAYRRKLAATAAPAAEHAEKQEAAGKISAAVTETAPAAKAPAKEVLRLSKGEVPSDKAVGGGKAVAEEIAIAKEEEAIATGKAMKEAQERTAILEKNVQDMQRLAELEKQSAPVSAPAAAVAIAAASAPQPASGVAPAKPQPKVAPPRVVEQPSMIDELLADPLYLGAGAALLLLLGGLGFMVARRGKQGGGKKKGKDLGATTGHIAAPVTPSPETGDFTHAPVLATAAAAATAESEEVDPIGEADLFLTFGRDVQAEEVLKEALKKNPNNIPVKLKLLSIYSNRKDTNSFYSLAREIKESGDAQAWEQTAAMGRELEPSNPFYGGTGVAPAPAPAPEAKAAAAAPAVDFDLGFGAAAPAAPEFGSQSTIVMETPSQERTAIMSSEELRSAAQPAPMDFDITGTNPNLAPTKPAEAKGGEMALSMGDLVFDVTATHPNLVAPAAPAAAAPAEDAGLTFTLDFPMAGKAKPAAAAPELGLGEISLDLDKLASSTMTGAGMKDEHWQEVATKLDLAKAYQEMGDAAGAREILEEVLRDGDAQQRENAQALMQQL